MELDRADVDGEHLCRVDGNVQRLALELVVTSGVADAGPAGFVVQIETGTAVGEAEMLAVVFEQTIQRAVQMAFDGGAAGGDGLRQPRSQRIEGHVRRLWYVAEQGRGVRGPATHLQIRSRRAAVGQSEMAVQGQAGVTAGQAQPGGLETPAVGGVLPAQLPIESGNGDGALQKTHTAHGALSAAEAQDVVPGAAVKMAADGSAGEARGVDRDVVEGDGRAWR